MENKTAQKKPFITRYVANKRTSIILKSLKKLDKKRIKILDVGCGNRFITNTIKNAGYNIIGIDKFTSKEAKWITEDPDFVMDAMNMTFNDNSFDVVLALEVIEHCNCIDEIKRVLKPNGFFFCSTPSPTTDWIRKILIALRLLENQDFADHDNLIDLRKIRMNLLEYRKMFLRTSQFGIFKK